MRVQSYRTTIGTDKCRRFLGKWLMLFFRHFNSSFLSCQWKSRTLISRIILILSALIKTAGKTASLPLAYSKISMALPFLYKDLMLIRILSHNRCFVKMKNNFVKIMYILKNGTHAVAGDLGRVFIITKACKNWPVVTSSLLRKEYQQKNIIHQ
jgi:hypothetical protein